MEQLDVRKDSAESNQKTMGRRQVLKAITATSGAVIASQVLPSTWTKPLIESGILPAHAATSATNTPQPGVTATNTPQPTNTPKPGDPPLGGKFAVMGTEGDGNKIIVFPNADQGLPNPVQKIVPGLPSNVRPHAVAYFGAAGGLISDAGKSRVHIVDLASCTLQGTISTSAVGYNGWGTIAVPAGSRYALASGDSSQLVVIEAPFNTNSNVRTVSLPGKIITYQTQAIVFNSAGRAFVYHPNGISVLDAPYNSIAFTIPVNFNSKSGAIAISPDGNTLLTTDFASGVRIFKAPFSENSTPETLTIAAAIAGATVSNVEPVESSSSTTNGASPASIGAQEVWGLDGINITSDGKKAMVCTNTYPHVFVISAPFSASSTVEEIPLPAGLKVGFEDIGISADGELAIVTGQSNSDYVGKEPAIFIQAPFTANGAKVFKVDIDNGKGRGDGAVRFQPLGT